MILDLRCPEKMKLCQKPFTIGYFTSSLLADPGKARGCSINTLIVDRPGVVGAVLQT